MSEDGVIQYMIKISTQYSMDLFEKIPGDYKFVKRFDGLRSNFKIEMIPGLQEHYGDSLDQIVDKLDNVEVGAKIYFYGKNNKITLGEYIESK